MFKISVGMEKEFDYKKIEDFVNRKLTPEARKRFEAEMAKDEALAEEVRFYQDVAGMSSYMRTIREAEDNLEKKNFFEKKTRIIPLRQTLAIAASLLLLIAIGFWWANTQYTNDSLALANSDISNFILDGAANQDPRGREIVAGENPLGVGINQIETQNYSEAISFFSNVPDSIATSYPSVAYYLGLSYFKTGDYSNAIMHFDNAIEKTRIASYRHKAEWLQIKAKLAAGMADNDFFDQLDTIAADDNHSYQANASKLKAKLNSLWRRFIF